VGRSRAGHLESATTASTAATARIFYQLPDTSCRSEWTSQSIRELIALVGSPQRRQQSLYNSPDYPAPSFYAGLAQITGCPEERLLQATFHFLIRRFGRSMYPHALHHFRRREPRLLFTLLPGVFSRVRSSFLLAALAIPGAPWMHGAWSKAP